MLRRQGLAIPLLIVLGTITIAILFGLDAVPRQLRAAVPGLNRFSKPAPLPVSEFYPWATHSEFGFPQGIDHELASLQDLCKYFPHHLLHEIQPVLKTGHHTKDVRLSSQLHSVSACFGQQLLIVSDKDELFNNHTLKDVIADIPESMRADWSEQFVGYTALYNQSVTATKDDGWKIDKFKFLSSISNTWRMRPERRWYVFYEGDTYVIWDNMFRFLQNFDPDKPWYFGSPSPGRKEGGENGLTTWFANGGPGFVLSREAMRRLTREDWDAGTGEYLGPKLTERMWDDLVHDCCGDSILGWALWQQGVKLSGMWPMFNPHPPLGVPFSDLYWCQPILTMHKPDVLQMESLWRWQWKARTQSRPLLYRDLALSYHNITSLTFKDDWDNADFDGYPGPDEATASAEKCAAACAADEHCFQWTHDSGVPMCTFVRSFRLGRSRAIERNEDGTLKHKFTSGWRSQMIQDWVAQHPCEKVQWVRPSITRIF